MAVDAFILHIEDFPGLGDSEYPGFPADVCPEVMPDLTKHHSVVADVFKRHPDLYAQLRGRRTALGVGLAKCIKTGLDNRGHPMIKTIGAVAGDEECYETFRPLFDQLIQLRHGEQSLARPHASAASSVFLSQLRPDPTEKYVLSVQVRVARNLQGRRFSPSCSFEERRDVERVAARALLELEGPLKGTYHPLRGSQSYPSKPGGMSQEVEQELLRKGLLFSHPDSSAVLSSGTGRSWPDARGVFVNEPQTLAVWVNEEEHLRAVAARQGGDLQAAYRQLAGTLDGVVASFHRHNDCPQGFACSQRLGFLTSCPSNIGTAMRVSAIVRLPMIMTRQKNTFSDWCSRRRLTARSAIGESGTQLQGVMEISNRDRLGVSENETVNLLIHSVAELVHAERLLEHGGAGLQLPYESAPVQVQSAAVVVETDADACALVQSDEDDANWEIAGATLGALFARAAVGGDGALGGEAAESAAAAGPSAQPAPPARPRGPPPGGGGPADPAGERQPSVRHLTGIKLQTAAMLEAAVDTGALSRALGSLVDPGGVEDIKRRTAEVLFTASQDGSLSGALASLSPDVDPLREAKAAAKIQAMQRGKAVRRQRTGAAPAAAARSDGGAAQGAPRGAPSAGPEGLCEELGRMKRVLEAALEDGSLERLLQSDEFSDEPVEESLADIRFKAADVLAGACDSGALTSALDSLRSQAKLDTEDIRGKMKEKLHAAALDGSLDQAFGALSGGPPGPPAEAAVDMEDVRTRMFAALEGAAESGSLELAFGGREAQPPGPGAEAPPEAALALPGAAPAGGAPAKPGGAAFSQCARALLDAVSGCDRRIGLLNATIAEVRQCINERDAQASQLEADLEVMRQEHQGLDAEIEYQRESLDQAEARAAQLQEGGRRLAEAAGVEALKQRHAALELDASLASARSETSTACTLCDHIPLHLMRDSGQLFLPAIGNIRS